jgi:hypothetical protein
MKREILVLFLFLIAGMTQTKAQKIDSLDFYKECPNEFFIICQHKPSYPGGDEILVEKLNMIEVEKKYYNKITIFFRVNCNGKATDFRLVKRTKADEIEKRVFEIISEQKEWLPPRQGSKPVNYDYPMSIEVKRGKFKILYSNTGMTIKWSDTKFTDNL